MHALRTISAGFSAVLMTGSLLSGTRALAAGCARPDFQAPRTNPTGDASWEVASADFNHDGTPDLALANAGVGAGGNSVSVLIGQGDATFQAAVNYAVGLFPLGITTADFNVDGTADLAVANLNSGTVSLLLGNGNGTFQAAVSLPGASPAVIASGDVNGDAKPDILIGQGLLLGNGNGTFQPLIGAPSGNDVVLADMNQDGKLDVVASVAGAISGPAVFLGNGNGTFQTGLSSASATLPWGITVADFDGDATLDVAVTDNVLSPPKIWVHLGNGDGTLQTGVGYASGINPATIEAGDFNGDGSMDLAAGVTGLPGAIFTYRGNGDGTFQAGVEVRRITPITKVIAGDFNHDGSVDLVYSNSQHPGANGVVLVGNGDGTFENDLFYAASTYPKDAATADFNNDGKLDMVIANSHTTTATVRLGNGNGTFLAKNDYPLGTNPLSVVTADFNNDGKADFAAANQNTFDVMVRLGNGNGTFQAPSSYPTVFGASSLVVGDFDRDNKVDIVAMALLGVYFLKGAGNGTFAAPVNDGLWSGVGNLSAADLNNDQKLDLVVAKLDLNIDRVEVMLGNGNGTFQNPVDYPVGISPQSATIGDFNKDGKPDIAVANFGCRGAACNGTTTSTVSILLGNGNGTFQAHTPYPASPNTSFVRAGDLNGDGRDDVATADLLPWTVSVLLSNPNGSLQRPYGFGVQHGPTSVAFADVDANGGLDMLVTNGTSNDVSILLNNCSSGAGGPEADLAITLSDSPDPASVGSSLTYTINVTNNGPAAATNVLVSNTLPGSVAFVSATAGCVEAGGTVSCNAGSLASGANSSVLITVTPNLAGPISDTASVTSDQADPVTANNSATTGTTVQGPQCADLTGIYSSVTPRCKSKKGVMECSIKGKVDVQNLGNITAPESLARFYLSSDAVLDDPGDTLLSQVSIKAVKTSKPGKARLKAELAPGMSTTGLYLILVVDAAGTIAECSESNNTTVYGPMP